MDEKLASWMEAHGIGLKLQSWVNNTVLATRDYSALEGLESTGVATMQVVVTSDGMMKVTKAVTYESDVSSLRDKLKDAENELKQAKKTISNQETTIQSYEAEAQTTTVEETGDAVASRTKRVRKA